MRIELFNTHLRNVFVLYYNIVCYDTFLILTDIIFSWTEKNAFIKQHVTVLVRNEWKYCLCQCVRGPALYRWKEDNVTNVFMIVGHQTHRINSWMASKLDVTDKVNVLKWMTVLQTAALQHLCRKQRVTSFTCVSNVRCKLFNFQTH